MGTDYGKSLAELRSLRWAPRYEGRLQSGVDVDMWALNMPDGEAIITIGVPPGRSDIIGYIAACCGNPVRWVTDMVHPPHEKFVEVSDRIADRIFKAASEEVDPATDQVNGYVLNYALAVTWFAFCAQLPDDARGRLLFEFMKIVTSSWEPPAEPAPVVDGGRNASKE